MNDPVRVLALSGGVGGAKLSLGLQGVLPAGTLGLVVNTGDDFEHLGLAISPDLDTTVYTLAGIVNPELGWGREADTWNCLTELARLGGESWFRLGDKDLALHLERTRRLARGEGLGAISEDVARRLGVATRVLPMSEDRVRTLIETDEGRLGFQQYFVARRCEPVVRRLHYEGAAGARPLAQALELAAAASLSAIIVCPSNPYLSIDPILAIPGWRATLEARTAPVIAVSPLIAGQAVKGPTAKIMRELDLEVSSRTIAAHYAGLIDGIVIDEADAELAGGLDIPVHVTRTLMRSLADKEHLARAVLGFAAALRADPKQDTADTKPANAQRS
jgi:LPPG:FO 2-phospho-L-lactate transferase